MSGSENLGRKTLDDLQAFGSQTGAPGRQMLSAAEMMADALASRPMRARRPCRLVLLDHRDHLDLNHCL